ncbi:hypothetical protein KP509_23G019800 [Ceratopteris richardii]|nr:hypothetical protein KP509_23G019800 [Ceratopteris richardii]
MEAAGCSPNNSTYNILIGGLCQAGQVSRAYKLWKMMKSKNLVLDASTHKLMVHALCLKGKVRRASKVFREMEKLDYPPDQLTLRLLIDGLCQIGNVKEAVRLFDVMLVNDFKPSVALYNTLLEGLHDSGMLDGSRYTTILKNMVSKDCVPDLNTYNILIASNCQAGKMEEAYAILELMKGNRCVPDNMTFTTMICGLCIIQRADNAFKLYKKMLLKQSPPPIHVCKLLADCLQREGNLREAKLVLRFIKSSEHKIK